MLRKLGLLLAVWMGHVAMGGLVEEQVLKAELKKLQDIRASRRSAEKMRDHLLREAGGYELDCLVYEKSGLSESSRIFAFAPKFKRVKAPLVYWDSRDSADNVEQPQWAATLSKSPSAKTAVVSVETNGLNSVVVLTAQSDDGVFQIGDSRIRIYSGVGSVPIFHFKFGGTDSTEICTAKTAGLDLLPKPFRPSPARITRFSFKETKFEGNSLSADILAGSEEGQPKDGAARINALSNQVKLEPVGGDTVRVTGKWMGVEVNALASFDRESETAVFVGLNVQVPTRLEIDLGAEKMKGSLVPPAPPDSFEVPLSDDEDLSQAWITSLVYSLTLFAEKVRMTDETVRAGDVVWARGLKRALMSGLVLSVNDSGDFATVIPINFYTWTATHQWPIAQVMKSVLTHKGFSVGESAVWGRISPEVVRINYMLSDGTAWVTRRGTKEEKVVYVSDLSKPMEAP